MDPKRLRRGDRRQSAVCDEARRRSLCTYLNSLFLLLLFFVTAFSVWLTFEIASATTARRRARRSRRTVQSPVSWQLRLCAEPRSLAVQGATCTRPAAESSRGRVSRGSSRRVEWCLQSPAPAPTEAPSIANEAGCVCRAVGVLDRHQCCCTRRRLHLGGKRQPYAYRLYSSASG